MKVNERKCFPPATQLIILLYITLHLVFSEGGVAFTLNNKKMCEAVNC